MIQKILFLGSKNIGLRVLKLLQEVCPAELQAVFTMDDRADSRTEYDEIHAFCAEKELPLKVPANRKQTEEMVAAFQPDLCFVTGWYWLFSEAILRLPNAGFVGIHHSLLPKYRGGAPVVWALINGESEVGSSLFQFTPEMDDGPLWGQVSVPVGFDETIGKVLPRLEQAMLDELRSILPEMLDGSRQPVEQDQTQATYGSQRTPEDGLIDWSWSAERVHHFIRAQSSPYPGAFSWLKGEKITILKARLLQERFDGPSGQVVRIMPEGVIVTCGERGAVVLEQLQCGGVVRPARVVIQSIRSRFSSHVLAGG